MRVLLAAMLAIMAGCVVPAGASAQAMPPGSYQATCIKATVQNLLGRPGEVLVARCQTRKGAYVDASLVLPCRGDIQNRNGKLACKPGPNPFVPPPGSYARLCKNASMAGPILRAECRTALRILYVPTSINVLDCRGRDIAVGPEGRLFCR